MPTDRLLSSSVRSGACLGALGVSALLTASVSLPAVASADDVPADVVAQPGDDDGTEVDDGQEGPSVDAPDAGSEEAQQVPEGTPEPPSGSIPAPPPGVATEEPGAGPDPPVAPTPPPTVPPVAPTPPAAQPPADPAPTTPPPAAVHHTGKDLPPEDVEVITDHGHKPPGPSTGHPRARPQQRAAGPASGTASPRPEWAGPSSTNSPPPSVAAPTPVSPAPQTISASSSGRIHTLRSGESLWSVATAALGPSASPAQIAAYVSELWDLNADRIASGNPSIVRAGQQLVLPRR